MSVTDPDDLARVDQDIRINELKHQIEETTDGEVVHWESEELPQDTAEQFLNGVLMWETAQDTTHLEQLQKLGFEFPAEQKLNDQKLTEKLWELIDGLKQLRVYLSRTDHLSDRELYKELMDDLLIEPVKDLPHEAGWNCHLDILGGCSEEDLYLSRKYYDDEEERKQWMEDWPEDEMPDHVDPPYDRDRILPKPEYQ